MENMLEKVKKLFEESLDMQARSRISALRRESRHVESAARNMMYCRRGALHRRPHQGASRTAELLNIHVSKQHAGKRFHQYY